ncbi:MAG: phenylacetate-CoA oxygenase subunit PaaJ [Arthrobacter koreensis]|uniref:1,2-phenylacetyl-CoA epoxidase subunit PaaD n=1 Tax=Arthrobacter koreensis TaxID=199136 RepID=UPI002409569D|nr:1,2-phenylacetyl-CoA epoxidase subunit PaaD [Arthrobacter koreensis]MDF2496896.1 phenylacetate-CoA oxygenase subunit PaaJ [Arthrobacter koreensis]
MNETEAAPAVDAAASTQLRPADPASAAAWDVAATVCDPEIPVLTIEDLGVLRSVEVQADNAVRVAITPTYSGCPAMDAIRDDVTAALRAAGYGQVQVDLVLAPAWTTDWMSESGKTKLNEYGIAPPTGRGLSVKCPQCSSLNTREMTRFGSTSCKALYVCRDCQEPFDYFKVL